MVRKHEDIYLFMLGISILILRLFTPVLHFSLCIVLDIIWFVHNYDLLCITLKIICVVVSVILTILCIKRLLSKSVYNKYIIATFVCSMLTLIIHIVYLCFSRIMYSIFITG